MRTINCAWVRRHSSKIMLFINQFIKHDWSDENAQYLSLLSVGLFKTVVFLFHSFMSLTVSSSPCPKGTKYSGFVNSPASFKNLNYENNFIFTISIYIYSGRWLYQYNESQIYEYIARVFLNVVFSTYLGSNAAEKRV